MHLLVVALIIILIMQEYVVNVQLNVQLVQSQWINV